MLVVVQELIIGTDSAIILENVSAIVFSAKILSFCLIIIKATFTLRLRIHIIYDLKYKLN
jgi:hypothetical protein